MKCLKSSISGDMRELFKMCAGLSSLRLYSDVLLFLFVCVSCSAAEPEVSLASSCSSPMGCPTNVELNLRSRLKSLMDKRERERKIKKEAQIEVERFHPLSPRHCGQRRQHVEEEKWPQSRIVGGEISYPGQFPWQAQILVKPDSDSLPYFQCGGTLILDNVVVTSAHCVKEGNESRYIVHLGKETSNPSDLSCHSQVLRVDRIVIHPDFDEDNLLNDIALLWILTQYNQSAHFTEYVQPACLPDRQLNLNKHFYKPGTFGTVSGWGVTNETLEDVSEQLQHVRLPVLSSNVCKMAYKDIVKIDTTRQFCAGGNTGQDACTGDSGGPFVIETSPGRFSLIGIVGFGKGCARQKYPGVYTKIHSFLSWVENCVKINIQSNTNSKADEESEKNLVEEDPIDERPTALIATESTATPTNSAPTASSNVITVGPICQGDSSLLQCENNLKIEILRAFFGLTFPFLCSGNSKAPLSGRSESRTLCYIKNATQLTKLHCDGKTICSIHSGIFSSNAFQCRSPLKFISVQYSCVENS